MKLSRVMLAAPKSGSGKTILTCALLQTLKDLKTKVVAYKCGPDYIDPMFHQRVINVSSKNLDTFFTNEEEIISLFLNGRNDGEFAVLEGVMGVFDGLGGIREEGSSYHLATVTQTPIILVVDAKGMGRSVLPLIAGFLKYDTENLIKGVILNRMSKGYYETIKTLIEEELQIAVVGYFPEQKQFAMESRHLGLMMPDEICDLIERLKLLSEEFQKTVEVERIIEIAKKADELDGKKIKEQVIDVTEGPVIAVAKDEAFCFYHEDNLRLLREYGAKIVFFSPIRDEELPSQCCGILIGGGYPELYGEALSKNKKMLSEIKRAFESDMPLVAECGGFMYLHSALKDKEGVAHEMAGAIPGECYYTGKLVRFGYIELEELQGGFLTKGEVIRGHEFHYFDSEMNGADCVATKPVTGKSYPCVIANKNKWIGFPHLYYPSNPRFASNFVKMAKEYKERKER